jgi:signal transduction histidine kinase
MKRPFNSYSLRFLCLFILLFAACRSNRKGDAFYSEVFETADKRSGGGDKGPAVKYVDSVFEEYPGASAFFRYKRYFLKKQYYFYDKHMYDSNDVYVDSMLIALELGNAAKHHPYEYAAALNLKGDYYYNANELDKAFEYYYRSRMAAPDTCAYANQTYHLGLVTYRQQRYDDAIGYFLQSLRQNKSCGGDSISFFRVQELLNNIALSYTQLRNADSAHYYYDSALVYIAIESSKYGSVVKKFAEMATGVIYGNIAKLYIGTNKYDTAEILLRKSIAINNREGYDRHDAMLAEMRLAELYNKAGKLPQAINILTEVKDKLDSFPKPAIELRRRYLMYQYYNAAKQPGQAFQYLQDYVRLKDSAGVGDNKLNRANVDHFLKSLETEYRLKLVTKDNELNRVYLAITIGLVLLTAVVIVLVFMSYKRSRANVQKLTLLNYRVNEQKDQLEYAMTELKKLNSNKDRILYMVAHDLKNPISGIMALTQVILEDSDEMGASQRKSLEIINGASEHSLKLIAQLLDLGMEGEQQVVKSGDIAELKGIVDEVIALLQYEAENKKIKLVSYVGEPIYINAVKEKIWRASSNLLSNAIKFSSEGTSVEIAAERTDGHVRVSVADKGIGIPENIQPLVFNMFSAAKRPGTAGESSFGLGLSITKGIIEAHKGEIWFDTKPGEGTTFYFEIQLAEKSKTGM